MASYQTIPEASPIRSRILRWLPPADVVAASHVDSLWYDAGAEKGTWQGKVTHHPRFAQCDKAEELELESAAQYELVLRTLSDPAINEHVDGMLQAADDQVDLFVKNFALMYGLVTTRYTQHMGVTHLLLRHPNMRRMFSVTPIREGSVPYDVPRNLLPLRFSSYFYESATTTEGQMWLVSLLRWALTTNSPFHRLKLSPVQLLLKNKKVQIAPAVVRSVVHITLKLMERLQATVSPSPFDEIPTKDVLDDDDVRMVFGVFYLILERFPELKSEIVPEATRVVSADVFEKQLAASAIRQQLAQRRLQQAEEERELRKKEVKELTEKRIAEHKERRNERIKILKEKGILPAEFEGVK